MLFFVSTSAFADGEYDKLTLNILEPTSTLTQGVINFNIARSQINAFNEFTNAAEKFAQSNVIAAYDDFKYIIDNVETNDFGYLQMAGKLSEFGFFDLAQLALSKTSDNNISANHIENLERFYTPKKRLGYEEEILLAEAYSNIIFNDQSTETVSELLANKELLKQYDYANYILALGAYKANNLPTAEFYIEIAVAQNPENLNYKVLQAEILANGMRPDDALKIVDLLKKEKLNEYEFERKINALEQYVLYKCANKNWEKDYHLGYYYFYENEYNKSVKTLLAAIDKKKKNNAKVQALLSRVYLSMQEYEKAEDNANKTYKITHKNPKALLTLGDLSYLKKDYKHALKYYKDAEKYEKNSYVPSIKSAKTYMQLGKEKKSRELYTKVLKDYSNCYEAYYSVALIEPYKELSYLKKSVGINLGFIDGWLALARYEIKRDNLALAQEYLSNAYYIDSNDYRYYYYQGLLYKSQEDFKNANFYFNKCLSLNPDCAEAKKELEL
jgi:tetratricopeptide (TPR) repeat protein